MASQFLPNSTSEQQTITTTGNRPSVVQPFQEVNVNGNVPDFG